MIIHSIIALSFGNITGKGGSVFDVEPIQLDCLTQALYHEARGESYTGQLFVGFVIKNRVESDKFPDSFCQVIEQPWQFSFVHENPNREFLSEKESADWVKGVANIIMISQNPLPDDVLYYHADHVTPDWNYDLLEEYQSVGNHIFYAEAN